MICHYCHPQSQSLARNYNIEFVQPRFIPTYQHTQLFTPSDSHPHQKVRCTPTFHSQIMRTDGYGQSKNHPSGNGRRTGSAKPVIYKNHSKGRKQEEFYNQKGNCCLRSNQLWYDSTREDLIKKLQGCCTANYAHERKQLDLGSDSVFGGGIVDVCPCPSSHPIPPDNQANEQKHPQTAVQEVLPAPIPPSLPQPAKSESEAKPSPIKQQKREAQTQTVPQGKKALKKSNTLNRTVVQGWPSFTIVRKRDW